MKRKAGSKGVKTIYFCSECGWSSPKWLGKCGGCASWNTLVEEIQSTSSQSALAMNSTEEPQWSSLFDENQQEFHLERWSTGISELDRVLGGGLVPDAFTLVGGDPGIGKSTLLLQMACGISKVESKKIKILYVSGEESISQIRGRAARIANSKSDQIFLAAETRLERVFEMVEKLKPSVLVLDSLQTFATLDLESAPGSVSQVREVAARLMMLAKTKKIAVWLVGHVTKDGNIAGPKVVEHMVDTVLSFEGDSGVSYRILRAVKNRFGSIRELGVFEMQSEGLREVTNPSQLFLSERSTPVMGTAVSACIEGTRPILVELQALVSYSALALPRRTASGFDQTKISLLAAVLERHMGLSLAQKDLFFNVAGGLKLSEPACDLAAAASIWSSLKEVPLPIDCVFLGELGLTGEVRRISQPELRIDEVRKLGFKKVVLPALSRQGLQERSVRFDGVDLFPISQISELPEIVQKW